jgi:hypothetical protein
MKAKDSLNDEVLKRLLAWHRRLLELERIEYERTHGRTLSPFEFLKLLTSDSEFAWLRPLSKMMADFDSNADRVSTYKEILDVLSDAKIHVRRSHHNDTDREFSKLNQDLTETLAKLITG